MKNRIRIISSIALGLMTALLMSSVSFAAVTRAGRSVCPRCGNHTGTYTRATGDYHITRCSGCGTSYQQTHYKVIPTTPEEGDHTYCSKCGLRFV